MTIKGYLKNITDNNVEVIEANGLFDQDTINYQFDNINNKITINDNLISIERENDIFKSILSYEQDSETISWYLLKAENINLEINIYTKQIIIKPNLIHIFYTVIDSNIDYEFKLEMEG